MARDVDVRCTDLIPGRQVGKRQWHLLIVGHQAQHPRIKSAHRVTQEATQMGLAPAVVQNGRQRLSGL